MSKNTGKRRKAPMLLAGFMVLAIAAIFLLWVRPSMLKKQEEEAVRETVDVMMQAYMRRDLSETLSYTDLKNHSENAVEFYVEYLEKTSQIDALTAVVLESSTDILEEIVLNLIREYEIEKIEVENGNAVISINLSVPDFSQVAQAVSEEEISDAVYAAVMGLVKVDLLSKMGDIISNPWAALSDIPVEYFDGVFDEYLKSLNMKITAADDKSAIYTLRAYKKSDTWVIEAENFISEIIAETEDVFSGQQ